jgi:hypothetical protein
MPLTVMRMRRKETGRDSESSDLVVACYLRDVGFLAWGGLTGIISDKNLITSSVRPSAGGEQARHVRASA